MFKQSDLIRILNKADQEVVIGSILNSEPYERIKQNRTNAIRALTEAITDLFPGVTGTKALVINYFESTIAAILQHVLNSPEIDVAGEIETPGIIETIINIITSIFELFDSSDEEEEIEGLRAVVEELETEIESLRDDITSILEDVAFARNWARNWYNAIVLARNQTILSKTGRIADWDEPGLPIRDAGNWDRDWAYADALNSCRKGYKMIRIKLANIEDSLN